jgi:hypothetical protein
MLPDEPTDEERQEELPEDNQTPFQPADPPTDPALPTDDVAQGSDLDDTHPATDTNVDPHELYDAGRSAAANAEEPNQSAGNFTPGSDAAGIPAEDEDPDDVAL